MTELDPASGDVQPDNLRRKTNSTGSASEAVHEADHIDIALAPGRSRSMGHLETAGTQRHILGWMADRSIDEGRNPLYIFTLLRRKADHT
jgi:hypothetical protein